MPSFYFQQLSLGAQGFRFVGLPLAIKNAIPLKASAENILVTSFPLLTEGFARASGMCKTINQIKIIIPSRLPIVLIRNFNTMEIPDPIKAIPAKYVQKRW